MSRSTSMLRLTLPLMLRLTLPLTLRLTLALTLRFTSALRLKLPPTLRLTELTLPLATLRDAKPPPGRAAMVFPARSRTTIATPPALSRIRLDMVNSLLRITSRPFGQHDSLGVFGWIERERGIVE